MVSCLLTRASAFPLFPSDAGAGVPGLLACNMQLAQKAQELRELQQAHQQEVRQLQQQLLRDREEAAAELEARLKRQAIDKEVGGCRSWGVRIRGWRGRAHAVGGGGSRLEDGRRHLWPASTSFAAERRSCITKACWCRMGSTNP